MGPSKRTMYRPRRRFHPKMKQIGRGLRRRPRSGRKQNSLFGGIGEDWLNRIIPAVIIGVMVIAITERRRV